MSSSNPIGGYLELEINGKDEFYPQLYNFNTGRACLEVVLKSYQIDKVYLPYYSCEVLLEPIIKLGIDHEFYHIDRNFEVTERIKSKKNEFWLYTNYFGLKSDYIKRVLLNADNNVIIDNSQAFFSPPTSTYPTFYSARKFFGVSDGAYLNIEAPQKDYLEYEQDISFHRMAHLLKRLDLGPEEGYADFVENDNKLVGVGIKRMSKLTKAILKGVDYEKINQLRIANYSYLHTFLNGKNDLSLCDPIVEGPLAYPFFFKMNGLREHLIANRVYVPTYWNNVKTWAPAGSIEVDFVNHLLPLPIHQGISFSDLDRIISLINCFDSGGF